MNPSPSSATDCWLCAQLGRSEDHSTPTHQMILDWESYWHGPEGWARKQALIAAKKAAREMLGKKKKRP